MTEVRVEWLAIGGEIEPWRTMGLTVLDDGIRHDVEAADGGIDGVSETDGLDVVSGPLGARFPEGLLVVQDGRNLSPRERQNYKFVSWRDIAGALGIK